MKKFYIQPLVEPCEMLSGNVLWGSSTKPEPTNQPAPTRQGNGDGPTVKLTKMYI